MDGKRGRATITCEMFPTLIFSCLLICFFKSMYLCEGLGKWEILWEAVLLAAMVYLLDNGWTSFWRSLEFACQYLPAQ